MARMAVLPQQVIEGGLKASYCCPLADGVIEGLDQINAQLPNHEQQDSNSEQTQFDSYNL